MREVLLRVHRYVALTLALFLVVIGLTGSIIVFFPELDRWVNADLVAVEPRGEAMDVLDLRNKLAGEDPDAHIYFVHFLTSPDESFSAYAEGAIDPKTGEAKTIGYDEVFADPYTGDWLGERHWGDISLERKDLMTFLYFLHYSLVLPEALGESFMGIVAFVFALDCFVGFYLALPRLRRARQGDKPGGALSKAANRTVDFFRRWKPSWLIETKAGTNRLVFDTHRAGGLWVWPMLLVFALSGVALNLPQTYSAVMGKVLHLVENDTLPDLEKPLTDPAVGWREALTLGRKYMAETAAAHGFEVKYPTALVYRREQGVYEYRVYSSRDLVRYGVTGVMVDGQDGSLRSVEIPTGHLSGNTFTNWINALHQAMVFGLPYRIFVSAMGLVLVTLTITGVLIWLRKRRARIARRRADDARNPAGGLPA
jgi:uncharacterized iron-regulated membrane protein